MGDDSGLTHQELAQAAGVSVTTIKGYRAKFPGCFPVLRQGKPLRFAPQSREACLAIRQGFMDGLSVEQLRERLRLRFPWSWRHPLPETPVISADLQRTVQDLARTIVRLTRAQAEASQRLDRLEDNLRNRSGATSALPPGAPRDTATLPPQGPELAALRHDVDAANATLQSLTAATQALGRQLATLPPRDARIVRIRNASGGSERYALHPLPPEAGADPQASRQSASPPPPPSPAPKTQASSRAASPGAGSTPPSAPGTPVLDLPLTVRSAKGEFLGVAGAGGHLTVRGFARLVARSLGLDPADVAWSGGPGGWRLDLGTSPAHSLDFHETTTPRGNRVALVQAMRIDGQPQDADALITLLRTLRQQFADD